MDGLTEQFRRNFFSNNNFNALKNFNPYKLIDDNNEVFNKGIPMVFITSPHMNLTSDNIGRDGFFLYVNATRPDLLKSLSFPHTSRPFIPIVSNQFKGISIPSTQTTAREVNETFYGYRQNLPSTTVNSVAGGELSITYAENKYLDIVSLHKLWLDYTEFISRGIMRPSDLMKRKRMIDYTASIYYFLLDFDGETIQFYSKYTGCSPSAVPYDYFSSEVAAPELSDVSIDYLFSYKEDLDPDILLDFNITSLRPSGLSRSNAVSLLAMNASKREADPRQPFEEKSINRFTKPYVTFDIDTKLYRLKFATNDEYIQRTNIDKLGSPLPVSGSRTGVGGGSGAGGGGGGGARDNDESTRPGSSGGGAR